MKDILFIVGGVIVAIIIYLLIFASFQKKSNLLMKTVYIDKDYDAYRKLLNSLSCKLLLSKKQRFILNMAVYEGENKEEELVDLFEKMHRMKLTNQEELDLYYNEIRYYIKKKDDLKINQLFDEVLEKYKDNNTSYIKGIIKEIYYLVEIDYKANTKLLEEVKNIYNNISIEQSKGIFACRISRLYHKKNDKMNSKLYYEKAIQHLNKETVDNLLKDIKKDIC